jgi:UDP:flavonoid glycosyltransferase YjiC (YdhE family)
MHVAIPALGTRGDVVPYISLGAGLRQAGHDVTLSTHEVFRGLVESATLRFAPLPGDPRQLFDAVRLEVSPWRPAQHTALIHDALSALVGQVDPSALLADWREADCVVFGPTTTFGHFVAEELGAASLMLALAPTVATGAFPHPVIAPFRRLGAAANRATWLIGERLQRQSFQEPLRPRARRAVGLAGFPLAASGRGAAWPPFPVVHAYSSFVLPRPTDWPAGVEVVGWLVQRSPDRRLPSEVEAFLDEGEPPLYVGFGSMPVADRDRLAGMLAETLGQTGDRALVSGLPARGPSMYQAEDLPHELLFPRVKAVVHHGGSGTVGNGLRAGRPTLVVPFVFDQFFWGRRVHELGAGPPPIPFARLSGERLARALEELAAPQAIAAAGALGERIRAEDGVGAAVEAIERTAA